MPHATTDLPGVDLADFLRETHEDDAVVFEAKAGAGLLLLHQLDLQGVVTANATVSISGEERPGLAQSAWRVFPLHPGEKGSEFISVGRSEKSDVMIPDGTISKFHAFFRAAGDTISVQDVGSRNGTAVNGHQVAVRGEGDATQIHSGDIVIFGSVPMTYLAISAFRDYVARLGITL